MGCLEGLCDRGHQSREIYRDGANSASKPLRLFLGDDKASFVFCCSNFNLLNILAIRRCTAIKLCGSQLGIG